MTSQLMSAARSRPTVSRRFVIGGLAAAGGAAALAGVSTMPTGNYDAALADQLRPFEASPDMREMVRAATLAANSHNTQPWKFGISADRIDIVPDFSRRTPVVDPDDHHLFASLGCAVENLVVAASHYGRVAEVAAPAAANGEITATLTDTTAEASPLFATITERQSSRSLYDGAAIATDTLNELAGLASRDGVEALILTDMQRREDILDLVLAGNRAQLEDVPFRTELKSWLRFNPNAAAQHRDGLLSTASGNPSLPDWLGPLMYDLTVKPDGDNERVAAQMRSSSGLVVFSASTDDPAGWVAAGRAYERFALATTRAGLQHAFVNQAVEVAGQRAELQSYLGLGTRRADLIIRFGRGPTLARSLRRPVDDVLLSEAPPMRSLLARLLAVAVPVIAILVAAAFVLPADFPWLPRQMLLAAIGIGGIALAEAITFRASAADLPRHLGFRPSVPRMLVACCAASLSMWLFLPLASAVTGTPLRLAPDWPQLIVGVVLVNGLAEEVIHRAFFFGRLREHTSFLMAASVGALLFAAQHLYLVATLGPAGGLASVLLALLLAYPLSHAFELGGRSILGPAILHTSSNAAFLVFGDPANGPLLLVHMLVVLISIYTVFFVRPTCRRPPVVAGNHDLARFNN